MEMHEPNGERTIEGTNNWLVGYSIYGGAVQKALLPLFCLLREVLCPTRLACLPAAAAVAAVAAAAAEQTETDLKKKSVTKEGKRVGRTGLKEKESSSGSPVRPALAPCSSLFVGDR